VSLERKQLFPGYLLTPFGWATQPLLSIVETDPALLRHVVEINRPHMHMIALGLAHLEPDAVPKIGPVLLRCSAPHVLTHVLGRPPVGIKRVLHRLPFAVLTAENYRRLIELLDDQTTGRLVLHHADTDIDDAMVEAIAGVPAALRSVAFAVLRQVGRLDGLADGLRLVVARGAALSFEALVADLAQQRQPAQFIARLRHLIAGLPLPDIMPPPLIGEARRLDYSREIQLLAKQWQNCLACYVPDVDEGTCAIYLWDDPMAPAACLVSRHGRLGWVLHEPMGPNNADLDPGQLETICSAFAAAGVAEARGVDALDRVVEADWRTRHRRQRPDLARQRGLQAEAWQPTGGPDAA
jgi:hypothetical protein